MPKLYKQIYRLGCQFSASHGVNPTQTLALHTSFPPRERSATHLPWLFPCFCFLTIAAILPERTGIIPMPIMRAAATQARPKLLSPFLPTVLSLSSRGRVVGDDASTVRTNCEGKAQEFLITQKSYKGISNVGGLLAPQKTVFSRHSAAHTKVIPQSHLFGPRARS